MLKNFAFGKTLTALEMKEIQGGCPPPGCSAREYCCSLDNQIFSTALACGSYCAGGECYITFDGACTM